VSQSKYLITETNTPNSIVLRNEYGNINSNSIYLTDQLQADIITAATNLALSSALNVNIDAATFNVPIVNSENITSLGFIAGINGIKINSSGIITSSYLNIGTISASQELSFDQYNVIRLENGGAAFTLSQSTPVPAGTFCNLIVKSATAATSRIITFNPSHFRTTGTLTVLGSAGLARTYTISFISDGEKLNEVSRTSAMTT
jgi:hypothetical protein